MLTRIRGQWILGGILLLVVPLLAVGCSEDRGFAPLPPDLEGAEGVLAMDAFSVSQAIELSSEIPGTVFDFTRELIAGDVAHYSFKVQVGPSEYDVIGMHRVVQERRSGWPIHTHKTIFLQHGDAKNFVGMFLPAMYSPSTPETFGLAFYLAQSGVDVWGIDQSWTLVPSDNVDMSYAEDWGMDRQIEDLGTALALARQTRLMTGSGYAKMHLLGYSSGAMTGFSYVNHETQVPRGLRHVRGYVPVDMSFQTDDPDLNQMFLNDLGTHQTSMSNGEYLSFVPFALAGGLGRHDPDGASPIIPGFTNLQAALFFGAGPIFGVGSIHYLAGIWDATGLPTGLQFVTNDQWFDFMESAPQWEATRFMLDYSAIASRAYDVPWDDYLGQITVPVLNVAAAGGIGPYSYYALSMLGSDDIENLNIQLQPEEARLLDFGHIDIFIAEDAPELVWSPLLRWIEDHTQGRSDHGPVAVSD